MSTQDPPRKSPPEEPPADRFWRMASMIAAIAALVVLPLILVLSRPTPGNSQSFATRVGGLQKKTLADGTIVSLNTSSSFNVTFTENARKIELTEGEASFDVAHDPARPLTVKAGKLVVRAIGTEFNVRIYDREKVTVAVAEGAVAVSQHEPPGLIDRVLHRSADPSAAPAVRLATGLMATSDEEGLAASPLTPVQLKAQFAWRDGLLMFEDQALSEIVQEFNRYSDRKIVITDPTIEGQRLSGQFKIGDDNQFLLGLAGVMQIPLKVIKEDNGRIVKISRADQDKATRKK